jgi:hypothetical protein
MKVIWKDNGDDEEIADVKSYVLFVRNDSIFSMRCYRWNVEGNGGEVANGTCKNKRSAKACAEAVVKVLLVS